MTLYNHEDQNKILNNNAFKDVCVTEKNDIGDETAREVDKLKTKSKKGLSARVPSMGIAPGSEHIAPGGHKIVAKRLILSVVPICN